jgi:hypothetical protein
MVAEAYAGTYRSQSGIGYRVGRSADKLVLAAGEQPPLPLYRASESEFFATALNLRAQFERADDGTVRCLILTQGGLPLRLARETGA